MPPEAWAKVAVNCMTIYIWSTILYNLRKEGKRIEKKEKEEEDRKRKAFNKKRNSCTTNTSFNENSTSAEVNSTSVSVAQSDLTESELTKQQKVAKGPFKKSKYRKRKQSEHMKKHKKKRGSPKGPKTVPGTTRNSRQNLKRKNKARASIKPNISSIEETSEKSFDLLSDTPDKKEQTTHHATQKGISSHASLSMLAPSYSDPSLNSYYWCKSFALSTGSYQRKMSQYGLDASQIIYRSTKGTITLGDTTLNSTLVFDRKSDKRSCKSDINSKNDSKSGKHGKKENQSSQTKPKKPFFNIGRRHSDTTVLVVSQTIQRLSKNDFAKLDIDVNLKRKDVSCVSNVLSLKPRSTNLKNAVEQTFFNELLKNSVEKGGMKRSGECDPTPDANPKTTKTSKSDQILQNKNLLSVNPSPLHGPLLRGSAKVMRELSFRFRRLFQVRSSDEDSDSMLDSEELMEFNYLGCNSNYLKRSTSVYRVVLD